MHKSPITRFYHSICLYLTAEKYAPTVDNTHHLREYAFLQTIQIALAIHLRVRITTSAPVFLMTMFIMFMHACLLCLSSYACCPPLCIFSLA